MTEQEYRAAEGVNKSTLWAMRRSPAHYRWLLDNPSPDTAALKLGRAVHAAVLTPEIFASDYAVVPDGIDRRTKSGKEAYEAFILSSAGKEILSADDAELARAIAAAVAASDDAMELLQGTEREVPLFWDDQETGLRCKCRVDAFSAERGIMIDLKTCTDASTEAFTREALKFGYHVQAAHYVAGFYERFGKVPDWWFIAVEKSPPYAVNVLSADDAFICCGEGIRSELMHKVKKCREADQWPGYGVNQIFLPAWAEG